MIWVYVSAWFTSGLFFASRVRLPVGFRNWPTWRMRLDRIGAVAMWVHIAVAYVIAHQGSHLAAVEHVAERTEQMTGVHSGSGIYANFVTALAWTALAAKPRWLAERPGLTRGAEFFLWLMFLSATILFAKLETAIFFSFFSGIVLLSMIFNRQSSIASPSPPRDASKPS